LSHSGQKKTRDRPASERRPIFTNENCRQILLFKRSNLFVGHPFCTSAIA